MNIFFDFDGTLIDISEKYYEIYIDLCIEYKLNILSTEEYWRLRRNRYSIADVININNTTDEISAINKKYLDNIEDTKYLDCDKLIFGVSSLLQNLNYKHRLILLTRRKVKLNLYYELNKHNITSYFSKIFSHENPTDDFKKSKIIAEYSQGSLSSSIIVGDTEDDINCGKELDIGTFAVLTGIRNEAILKSLNPTAILQSVNEITKYL